MTALAEVPIVVEAPVCLHEKFSSYDETRGPFDDHVTDAGQCLGCREWLILTTYADGRCEDRRMTERELDALQAIEDRYRRNE